MKHRILFILSLILFTGCSSQSVSTTTVTPAPTMTFSPVPATVTITPSSLPPTARLVPSSTPFVPKATIKIASQGPLSGASESGGSDIRRGAELAVKQFSDPLMQLGYQIEFVSYDDQNEPRIAVKTAKEIVADPEILCGVGPYTSSLLNQVKEIYHQAGLAFVSPSASAAFATGSGYLEINRLMGRHDSQGVAEAQFAKAQGFSRVFSLSGSSNYEQFVAYHFRNEATQLGIEIVGYGTITARKGFGKLIKSLMAANPDLVYFSTLNVEQAGTFIREARAAGYTGAFLGNDGIADPALLGFAGPSLLDGGGVYYTAMVLPVSYYPGAAKFLEDFKKFNGVMPQPFAAKAYDAAGVCMKAIEEASKAKGGEIPTRAEVAHRIRSLQDYQGITGVYNFDQYGDPNPAQYLFVQVVSMDTNAWSQNPMVISFEIAPPK